MIHDRFLTLEFLCVILGEIAALRGNSPLEAALVGFELLGKDLEQCRGGLCVGADKRDLILASGNKADIVEDLYAVNRL